jgi:LysM repeat protein
MTAGRSERGPVRIRRRGRHTAPSQVEKVAQQAGKAAPAVAIAGALVAAAPQASHALAAPAAPVAATALGHATPGVTSDPATVEKAASTAAHTATATLDAVQAHAVTVSAAKPARHAAAPQSTYYSVRGGDTLSTIAERYYGNPNDWQFLFHENAKTISNPNLIFEGERLLIPATPSNVSLTSYAPKHSKPAAAPVTHTVSETVKQAAPKHAATTAKSGGSTEVQRTSQGMYSCSGLEQIWEQAGGSAAHALMAAEIAMAESGGNPNAISPTDDFGLWQINASNGALATLNAYQNAKSAITLSDNGTNWGPWTTYHSGAYYGRC